MTQPNPTAETHIKNLERLLARRAAMEDDIRREVFLAKRATICDTQEAIAYTRDSVDGGSSSAAQAALLEQLAKLEKECGATGDELVNKAGDAIKESREAQSACQVERAKALRRSRDNEYKKRKRQETKEMESKLARLEATVFNLGNRLIMVENALIKSDGKC